MAMMAHLILCHHSARSHFSHGFILDGQMLNKPNDKETGDFILRRKKLGKNGEVVVWIDYSDNDQDYQPDYLEYISFCDFVLSYDRGTKPVQRMKETNQSGMPILQGCELGFQSITQEEDPAI